MQIFISAFDTVPDPRASNARHDLGELLVIAFVSVLCGSTSCAEMAAFGRAKERLFRDFLKLKVTWAKPRAACRLMVRRIDSGCRSGIFKLAVF